MNNIFVIGLDGFNRRKFEAIRQSDSHRFHGLLDTHKVHGAKEFDFEALLNEAEGILESFDGTIDGITNFWDFPASALHAILCRRHRVPGPSLESVIKVDHKYWSRLEQEKAVPELTPRFHVFDPFVDEPRQSIPLDYPFWVKPFLSYSSYLAFPVKNDHDLEKAVDGLRKGAGRYGKPFLEMMDHIRETPNMDLMNPNLCLAENPLTGQQCTVEGYSLDGEVESHGIIDTHWYGHDGEYSRYQYPTKLSDEVQQRMVEASRRVIQHIGYDNAGFNIEFYYDSQTERLGLLEINSRLSQSHSHLFEKVDGRSNHEVAVSVAEGSQPEMPMRQGTFAVAAKFFVREFIEDGIVQRVPSPEEVRAIEEEFPGTLIQVDVDEGMQLSEILDQDTYSYRLAMVHTAAQDEPSLMEKFSDIQRRLRFDIQPLAASTAASR